MDQSSRKFSTVVNHIRVCLPWKFEGGYSRKFWENRKKAWNFHTCTCI